MTLVDEIRHAWNWIGLDPVEVVCENDFGNLVIKDSDGKYWRLCPEDCRCEVVASNREELDCLSVDQNFLHDWYMKSVVALAADKCGPLDEGRKYCLKIPSLLGGSYEADNMATISLVELVRFSGHLARQTSELPDGAKVKLSVVE